MAIRLSLVIPPAAFIGINGPTLLFARSRKKQSKAGKVRREVYKREVY